MAHSKSAPEEILIARRRSNMKAIGRFYSACICALFAVTTIVQTGVLHAQGAGRANGRRISPKDTAALIALLDSLDRADSASDGRAIGVQQTFSVQAIARSYKVGAQNVSEQSAPISWRLISPRVAVRISASPMRLDVDPTTVRGISPARARVDFISRPGDTISVYGRTASSPTFLDSAETAAIGAIGTSTLDLESIGLGVTSQLGIKGLFSLPVGDFVVGLSGALEYEPRPSSAQPVYWRGTTARGAVSLYALHGDANIVGRVEVSASSADSLGGRNLYQGGGAVVFDVSVDGPFGGSKGLYGMVTGFYSRPLGNDRADQPNRLIPVGDFFGVSGSMLIPAGSVTITPTLAASREASHANATSGLLTTRLNGSGWAFSGGSSVDVPLPGGITLSPEAGFAMGSVGATLDTQVTRPRLRGGRVLSSSGFTDRTSGWWGGLTLAVAF